MESNISGGDGNDSVNGGPASDTLDGNGGDDTLVGDGGRDNLAGGLGSDTLNGVFRNDTFNQTVGQDTLIGGQRPAGRSAPTIVNELAPEIPLFMSPQAPHTKEDTEHKLADQSVTRIDEVFMDSLLPKLLEV